MVRQSLDWEGWFNLIKLEESKFSDLPPKVGVYEIRCRSKDGIIPIGRAGGVDPEGILYVGQTHGKRKIRY